MSKFRRDKDKWSYTFTSEPILLAGCGFTSHSLSREVQNGEHLSEFGLINPDTLHYVSLPGLATSKFSFLVVQENKESANMNGRLGVYPGERSDIWNPLLGRFLSPDNNIQNPDFSQNFNRYSYALNNPLK